jgi:DNA-binding transcriptional MerR regulator
VPERGTEDDVDAVFSTDEVRRLERSHPEGLSAAAIVELLRQRGVMLAEATFRKYVQLGLLPRSRRVGRKGKHRGSHGLYPAGIVGRIGEIRALMEAGLTLEEIQRSSIAFRLEIDDVRRSTDALVARLEDELVARGAQKSAAATKVRNLKVQADALSAALTEAAQEILPAEAAAHVPEDPAEVAREAERTLRGRRPARPAAAAANVGRKRPGTRPGAGR